MHIVIKALKLARNLMALVFLVGGLAMVVFGVLNIREAAKYKKWPMTHGFIIDNAAVPADDTGTSKKNIFHVNIVYEYFIRENAYYSTNISSFGYDKLRPSKAYYSGSIEKIKEVLDKYPIGESVPVYYNPENPQDTVIDPALRAPVFLPAILGVLLILISMHLHFFVGSISNRLR